MSHEYEVTGIKPGQFSFSTALDLIKKGLAVKRADWPEHQKVRLISKWRVEGEKGKTEPTVILFSINNVKYPYEPTNEDLLATDWAETTPILDNN